MVRILLILLFLTTLFLAYSNGSNDNFKGVATLFGSGTTSYRKALIWATFTTAAGSVCAIFMAQGLAQNFSGKGLVSDSLVEAPAFLFAVGLSAALTVILATIFGFPISTTHALTGALMGAGVIAVGTDFNFSKLGETFFLPLLLSPLIAVVSGAVLYWVFHGLRMATGVSEESCLCVDLSPTLAGPPQCSISGDMSVAMQTQNRLDLTVDKSETCARQYKGSILGISCQPVLDGAHFLSAGAVCFARSLNDTPKIAALLLLVKSVSLSSGMMAVALGMALGGILNARKVAETMSKKITEMNHEQGFTANLVTASLVIFASKLGVPVSTTHVAVGSITGMGLVTKKANVNVLGQIALSWLLTLPIAALLSAIIYALVR
jgi:PiT family inorganic phosphate transporter